METNLERLTHINKTMQNVMNYRVIQNGEGNYFIGYFRYKSNHSISLEDAYENENLDCFKLKEGSYYKIESGVNKITEISIEQIKQHVAEWSMETGEKWIDWKPRTNNEIEKFYKDR